MIADAAVSIDTAEARTRVQTLSVDTCFVLRALRVDDTFGSAIGRTANHLRQTRAVTCAAEVPGRVGVWPTGIGHTRVLNNCWSG